MSLTNESPINFLNLNASVLDIAIIPLDNRIPLASVTPVKLPFAPSAVPEPCPTNFTGRFLGFAGAGPRRHASYSVTRTLSAAGDVYRHSYAIERAFSLIPGVYGDAFNDLFSSLNGDDDTHTLEDGDSGGPLLSGSKLCGLNSARGPNFFSCSPVEVCVPGFSCVPVPCDPLTGLCPYTCGLSWENRHTRVDRQATINWLMGFNPPIFDERGNLFGTCGGIGPAALSDIDNDGDFIPDGCDPCPAVPDPNYRFNGTFTTLPDQDEDDVPDVCDNCPTKGNPRDPLTLKQGDSDFDGVGDACDKCPYSDVRGESDFVCCNTDVDCHPGNPQAYPKMNRCVQIGTTVFNGLTLPNACAGYAGRCSWGKDFDGDLYADSCDNCRTQHNPDQADDDHDGAGNVCDNCPGTKEEEDPYPNEDHSADKNDVPAMKCSSDADCVAMSWVAGSQCSPAKLIPKPGGGVVLGDRYCSAFPDADQDGLGNACDNCWYVKNGKSDYGGVNNQANCNLDIEIARGEPYPYVGDACDPNPCTRTQTGAIHHTDQDVWINVSLHPQVLPKSVLAQDVQSQASFDHKYAGTPEATVGARFCPCSDVPGKAIGTIEDCTDQCPLDAGEYVSSAFWFVPNMVPAPPSQSSLPALPPPGYPFTPGAEFPGLPTEEPHPTLAKGGDQLAAYGAAPTPVSWDLGQAPAPGLGPSKGKLGVLWTAVRDVPQMASGSPQIFQSHSNHYDSGFYGEQLKFEINGTALFACFFCQVDPCPQCAMSLDIHNLLIDPTQPVVAAQSTTQSIDLTASFSSAALDALLEPNVRWLQAAERGTWMKRGAVGLAALSTDATRVSSALVQVGGLVQPATRSAGDALVSAALELEPPSTGPAARSDFAAVLSGLENAVFVLGGKLLADGSQPGDVWRYGIESREWMRLPISGPTPRLVLAATYQPETRSLWLIDAAAGPGVARILRLGLDNLQVEVVGLYPRAGQVTRVELSNAPFGEFLLSGTSTKLNRVASVVLRPGKHHLFAVGGRFTPGQLALEPTLTRRGLTLPLAGAGGTVQNAFVAADDVYYAPAGAGPGQTPSKPTKPVFEAPTKLKPTVADCL